MPPPQKKARRTAERILETTLALFNRFGEPNVSTTLISAEARISPGNLYYHYASKDALVDALFDRHAHALEALLDAAGSVHHVEDAWLFFHMLFEQVWQYRFLYRDLNDLLSKNRRLETQVQTLLDNQLRAMRSVLEGLSRRGSLRMEPGALEPVAVTMVVVLTYWLSYEYVRDPRRALEPEGASAALMRGAFHLMSLLLPWLGGAEREHLHGLAASYLPRGGAELGGQGDVPH